MDSRAARPTVAEVLAHPSYPDTIFQLIPTKSGKLPVAANRGGPFNLDWEVHGTGDIKLVVCGQLLYLWDLSIRAKLVACVITCTNEIPERFQRIS
jgi:hypothetical protein